MKGYRLNPNREYVDKIITGTLKKDGHCPCVITVNEDTICPCKKMREEKIFLLSFLLI